jgi:hypothetical protein
MLEYKKKISLNFKLNIKIQQKLYIEIKNDYFFLYAIGDFNFEL